MFDVFKGVCGPNELGRIIKRILSLEAYPSQRLQNMRWVVSEGSLKRLLKTARKLLLSEPAVINLPQRPIVVIGDIHGDLKTLLKIMKANGLPPQTEYAFLGDYVDRGRNSMEVLMLVLALKCRYPQHVTVLRGNHETAMMTKIYGFMHECLTRYSIHMYTDALAVFNVMPLAAVVGSSVFLVHGGLSPDLHAVDDINNIARPALVLPDTLIADLLWSDPSLRNGCEGYSESKRGCGYCFGRDACSSFLQRNGLTMMIRAHETCYRGTRLHFGNCWTVFSQPKFCGGTNAGGTLLLHANGTVETQMYGRGDDGDLSAHEVWPVNAEDECQDGGLLEDNESVVDVTEMKQEAALLGCLSEDTTGSFEANRNVTQARIKAVATVVPDECAPDCHESGIC